MFASYLCHTKMVLGWGLAGQAKCHQPAPLFYICLSRIQAGQSPQLLPYRKKALEMLLLSWVVSKSKAAKCHLSLFLWKTPLPSLPSRLPWVRSGLTISRYSSGAIPVEALGGHFSKYLGCVVPGIESETPTYIVCILVLWATSLSVYLDFTDIPFKMPQCPYCSFKCHNISSGPSFIS